MKKRESWDGLWVSDLTGDWVEGWMVVLRRGTGNTWLPFPRLSSVAYVPGGTQIEVCGGQREVWDQIIN